MRIISWPSLTELRLRNLLLAADTTSTNMFQRFLHSQVFGALILIVTTAIALLWANSNWGQLYYDISHNQQSTSFTTVNLRIGKGWGDWTLSAWGRNLTDETYFTRGFFFGNEPPYFAPTLYTKFADPRSYGLTLGYRYGDG